MCFILGHSIDGVIKEVFYLKITPYLTFYGEANRALSLYEAAFQTKAEKIMRFRDMPKSAELPVNLKDEQQEWILQATLPLGDTCIRVSDTCMNECLEPSRRVAIAVEANESMIRHAFSVLSAHGNVLIPLNSTFFSSCYGAVEDCVGVKWELVTSK